MSAKVPYAELQHRMDRFRERMDVKHPAWGIAAIFSKINLYYFTGTMQDGVLLIPRKGDATFWVRRSYERASDESLFSDVRPMAGFRDAAAQIRDIPDTLHLETEIVPLALLQRFQKHFPVHEIRSLDAVVAHVRSIKSAYEQALMIKAGKIHRRVLEDLVPELLHEGISEAVFGAELFAMMVKEGHQGIVRFGMFDTEIVVGQIGFGESSIYPTYFDGPGGCYGMSPGVPVLGSRERTLHHGDLVFIDNACGVGGYQTDKTMTYMFETPLPDEAIETHHRCVEIQDEIASLLRPGNTPSQIYDTALKGLSPKFLENFMGFGKRRVKFLGHGVGLVVDELPAIAKGFDEPLQEGMILAIEPKKGITGVGMVGIENTFVVTPGGGRSITGKSLGLKLVE
ncbi:MAG: Xaa-Pro peptidase family protein [Methanomicrobiales archaeon]|nr:Xaa-Pro peptidase family protein [Methanomicrobiales archaeon]